MSGPLVSAIIPTYNRARLVREAVDSVLAQTYQNLEVIVVDDGSTDDTLAALRRYGDRIYVLSQKNAGPAAARNHGIRSSHGELIAFLDSDDLWLPTKVERQVTLLGQAGTDVPCCLGNIMMRWTDREISSFSISRLDPDIGEGIWLNADQVLATRFVLFNQSVMIRRSEIQNVGEFDESLRLLEDAEFSMRLSLEGPWAFIAEPLVIWRESSVSCYQESRQDQMLEQDPMIAILTRQMERLGRTKERQSLRNHLTREIRTLRRQIKAVELQQEGFWGARVVGRAMQSIERYRKAVFRRSPWFPKMKVESVESWRRAHTESIPPGEQGSSHCLSISLHS